MSQWPQPLPADLKDQLLAIDGMRLCGVFDNEHVSQLVELFAVDSRIVIAQERVHDKTCERAALPRLLDCINVQGTILSMDAHYAYADDLRLILNAGADYIVGIKGNQGNLEAELQNYFDQAHAIQYDSDEFKCHTTIGKDHGRIEEHVKTFDPKRGMADARRNAMYEPTYLQGLISRLFVGNC
jgi:predicted transposase YbfD/YdcC